jgi:hypothetical protein
VTVAEFIREVLSAPAESGGFKQTLLADPQGAEFSVSQLLGPH